MTMRPRKGGRAPEQQPFSWWHVAGDVVVIGVFAVVCIWACAQ